MSARQRRWLAVGAAAVLAALGAWLLASELRQDDASTTARVTRGRLEQAIETTGILEPSDAVVVTGRISGRMAVVAVRPGDRVAPGDIVAQLDRAHFPAAVAAATGSLNAAELALTLLEATAATPAESVAAAQPVTDAPDVTNTRPCAL